MPDLSREEAEQKRQDLIAERDAITAEALATKAPELIAKAASMYTIAERLRNLDQPIYHVLKKKDQLGDIDVRVRGNLSKSQLFNLLGAFGEVQAAMSTHDMERIGSADERLCKLLAGITPDLDYDFWMNADYDFDLVMQVVQTAMKGADGEVALAKN
jgi:hypothetical protein